MARAISSSAIHSSCRGADESGAFCGRRTCARWFDLVEGKVATLLIEHLLINYLAAVTEPGRVAVALQILESATPSMQFLSPTRRRVVRFLAIVSSLVCFQIEAATTIFNFPSDKLHVSKLFLASDGNFYGTTRYGGSQFKGTIFKLTPAGVLTTIYEFQPGAAFPSAGLVQGADGDLYGTTGNYDLINNDFGTVFKISVAGTFTVIHRFLSQDYAEYLSPLIVGNDGAFYGVSGQGGSEDEGYVFRVTAAGEVTELAPLINGTQSFAPQSLLLGKDGNFYGVSNHSGYPGPSSGGIVFQVTPAGILTILHYFPFHGFYNVISPLCQADDGNLYGVNERDGNSGQGVLFRITTAGTYTALHEFTGQADGGRPQGGLLQGSNGDLYGSTTAGGTQGGGTFFRITLAGVFTTVTNLSIEVEQPHTPEMSLLEMDNNLYGVTLYGGNANRGAAFKLSFSGNLTSLASFDALSVGSKPTSLILGRDGLAYGVTAAGGDKNSGTVFKRVGPDVITLHSFSGGSEGSKTSALIQATDGNFYGTTSAGNAASQAGTIFKITPAGGFSTLFTWPSNASMGKTPSALVQGTDGKLYGTTRFGGASGAGTIFKCSTSGVLSVIRTLNGSTDGGSPTAGLMQASDGNLYGLTPSGGSHSFGTVFRCNSSGQLATIFNFVDAPGFEYNFIKGADGKLYTALGGDGMATEGRFLTVTPPGTISFSHENTFVYSGAPLTQTYDGYFFLPTLEPSGDIHQFPGIEIIYPTSFADGRPASAIIQNVDGNLLGAALYGGNNINEANVGGTLFEIKRYSSSTQPLPTDFNNDNLPDYLLYNTTTRRTELWYLNGLKIGSSLGPILPLGWKLVGAGDFDRDGKNDYVLFNPSDHRTAIWYLSGTNTFARGSPGPTIANGYELVAVADLDNDSHPDFVLYNTARRQIAIWFLNDNVRISAQFGPVITTGYVLAGLADFNLDGQLDYLLYNSSTRRTAVWYLHHGVVNGAVFCPTIAAGWELEGVETRFGGSIPPRYVLYKASTRQTAFWSLAYNLTIDRAYFGPTVTPGLEIALP